MDETPADSQAENQLFSVDPNTHYTLNKVEDGYGWDVDCWVSEDSGTTWENHWHVWKREYADAKKEFERWRK